MSAKRLLIFGLIALILVATLALFLEVRENSGGADVDAEKLAAARAQHRRNQLAQQTVMPELEDPAPVSRPPEQVQWGVIRWKDSAGRKICLKGTGAFGPVMADDCRSLPQYQWRYHNDDKCLENRDYRGNCLNESRDRVELSRRGLTRRTNERIRHPKSKGKNRYYWVVADIGESENWCLLVDDSGDPPWYLHYAKCHDEMHAQKFLFDDEMGF